MILVQLLTVLSQSRSAAVMLRLPVADSGFQESLAASSGLICIALTAG